MNNYIYNDSSITTSTTGWTSSAIHYIEQGAYYEPKPKKPVAEGALAWLDRRVEEVCGLAFEMVPA